MSHSCMTVNNSRHITSKKEKMFTSLTRINVSSNKELNAAHKALEWYFYHSEAALGWKSNFSSMIKASVFKVKESSVNPEDELIDLIDSKTVSRESIAISTNKQRKIFAAFKKLSSRNQAILAAYFEEKRSSIDLSFLFDDKSYVFTVIMDSKTEKVQFDGLLPGVRLLAWTKTAKDLGEELTTSWMKKAHKDNDPKLAQLKEEADKLFFGALKKFSENY